MDWKEKLEELQAPFNYSDIKFRVGKKNKEKTKGMIFAYVSNRAIQKRLDDVFGITGWKNEFTKWGDNSQLCGISVWDNDKKEWVTKWDGADDTSFEGTKGGLSASMKRTASQWGIGRYLYMLKQEWVDIDQYGNFKNPTLPQWAYDQGQLSPTHMKAIKNKTAKKGFTEEKVCAKYLKLSFEDLNLKEFISILNKLDLYKDVSEGKEPELLDK